MRKMKRTANKSTRRGAAAKRGRLAAARRPAPKMSTRKSMGGRKSSRGYEPGGMTVREAGRKGGLIGGKKGGETVKRERGVEFYQEIGRKGGQRVRDLIAAGRRATERAVRRRHT
jgi:general stress protein YciG